MKKPKQVFRKKEEIIADLRKNKEWQTKMKFTKEVLFPALCNASTSIDEAQMLLGGFNTAIMQAFLERMKGVKLSEMGMESKLDVNNPKHVEMKALLSHLNDMSVFDAKDYIEGMRNEISMFLVEENKGRKLESLPMKWMDEI